MANEQGTSKSSSRRADQSLTEDFAGFKEEAQFVAITGRGDVNRTVLVEDRPGYIYVRRPIRVVTGTLEEYSEAQAYTTTEHRHGLPVIVQRSEDNPSRYVVKETWPVGLGQELIQSVVPSITPHRVSHELYNNPSGGNDPVMIETLQVRNLQTTPTTPSGLNVHVHSGFYVQSNNEVAWYTGTLVDMTDFVPTGTLEVSFTSLWLDPVTDTILKTNVTLPDTEANLADPATYLRWPTTGSIPLAAIRLTPGQSRITWSEDGNPSIIDLRLSSNLPPGDIVTQGHALDPGGGFHTGTLDHGTGLTGLIDDDHTNYALLAGRATGQTLIGGADSGGDLTLESTAHATKGAIILNDPVKLKASTILTLSTGAVTAVGPYHAIAAESGTADDLDTITASDDRTILVIQADTGDTITVKHSTGNVELNTGLDFIMSGDDTLLLFFDGTNWSDVGSAGEITEIDDQTLSAASTYDLQNITASRGDLIITGVINPSDDGINVRLRFNNRTGSTDYEYSVIRSVTTTVTGQAANIASLLLGDAGVGNLSSEAVSFHIVIPAYASLPASVFPKAVSTCWYTSAAGASCIDVGGGKMLFAEDIDRITLLATAGTIDGRVRTYLLGS